MKINFDIDIDLADREHALNFLKHVPASTYRDNKAIKHNVGVYFHDIPINPLTGLSALNFREAEDRGYLKIDFINNNVYKNIQSNEELEKLANTEPDWNLLLKEDIVKELAHIHNYFDIVKKCKPKSVEQLAMVLAMIRPAKSHLIDKKWDDIEKEIWTKPKDNSYYFKRSHAIAYAIAIVMQLNKLIND